MDCFTWCGWRTRRSPRSAAGSTVTHRGRRGRKGNREWQRRNRLTRSATGYAASMSTSSSMVSLAYLAVTGVPVTAGWHAREGPLAANRLHPRTRNNSATCCTGSTAAAPTPLPEQGRLATTIQTWWPEILAFPHTGITNAGSEGTCRVIQAPRPRRLRLSKPVRQHHEPEPPPPAKPAGMSTPANVEEPASFSACPTVRCAAAPPRATIGPGCNRVRVTMRREGRTGRSCPCSGRSAANHLDGDNGRSSGWIWTYRRGRAPTEHPKRARLDTKKAPAGHNPRSGP